LDSNPHLPDFRALPLDSSAVEGEDRMAVETEQILQVSGGRCVLCHCK
jgi:hypothetical protein